jgi:hypothetical protein
VINRAAILLRYKAPAVQWINKADPYDDDPGTTLESVNEECTVYLIADANADGPNEVNQWIRANYEILFENELFGWYTLESLWPKNRTLALFNKWFEIECHTVIEDTVGTPIIDDET